MGSRSRSGPGWGLARWAPGSRPGGPSSIGPAASRRPGAPPSWAGVGGRSQRLGADSRNSSGSRGDARSRPSPGGRSPLWLTTSTNHLTSWKKSARLKKSPSNSSSSGTVWRPAGEAPAVVPVPRPRCSPRHRHFPPSRWRSPVLLRLAPDCSARLAPGSRSRAFADSAPRRQARSLPAGLGGRSATPSGRRRRRRARRAHAPAAPGAWGLHRLGRDPRELDAGACCCAVELHDQVSGQVDKRFRIALPMPDLRIVGGGSPSWRSWRRQPAGGQRRGAAPVVSSSVAFVTSWRLGEEARPVGDGNDRHHGDP